MPISKRLAALVASTVLTLVHAADAREDVAAAPQRVERFQVAIEGGALVGGDGAGRFDVAPMAHLITTRRLILGAHFEYAYGLAIEPKGLPELTFPTRFDWTPLGAHHDGLVLRAGTRTSLTTVKTCSFGAACAELKDTPYGLGLGFLVELGLAVRIPMADSKTQNFELSASYVGGPMIGLAGSQHPLSARYQGVLIGMGVTSR